MTTSNRRSAAAKMAFEKMNKGEDVKSEAKEKEELKEVEKKEEMANDEKQSEKIEIKKSNRGRKKKNSDEEQYPVANIKVDKSLINKMKFLSLMPDSFLYNKNVREIVEMGINDILNKGANKSILNKYNM